MSFSLRVGRPAPTSCTSASDHSPCTADYAGRCDGSTCVACDANDGAQCGSVTFKATCDVDTGTCVGV